MKLIPVQVSRGYVTQLWIQLPSGLQIPSLIEIEKKHITEQRDPSHPNRKRPGSASSWIIQVWAEHQNLLLEAVKDLPLCSGFFPVHQVQYGTVTARVPKEWCYGVDEAPGLNKVLRVRYY